MRLEKPIALGRTSEIHTWKDGWVLKLFYDWMPSTDIEYDSWLPLMTAARLSEGIEELAPWLTSQTQRVLSS